MQRWDVILVGAGFGGLCTGALLARAGKRVLVLEKEGTIGGRAKTVLHGGHVLDDGAHIPSRAGHLERIFVDLGLPYPDVVPLEKSEIYHEGRWKSPRELFTAEMFKKVLAEMQRLTPEDLASLDDTPLRDWVERISAEPGIQMLFFYLGCATSVGNRFETYSTGEMIYILQEFLRAGRRLNELAGVIRGGMKAILEPLARYIEAHGGEVRLNSPVESIEIRDGHAVGVNVERGERIFHSQILDVETLEADFVVVTLPLWDLFSVLDESRLPRWWTDWVSWLAGKVSYAWSVIYGLDEPLFDLGTFRWAPNLPRSGFSGIFFPMPTYGDGAGQFQFHVSYQGHYDEMPDLLRSSRASVRRKAREIIAMLEQESVELYPALKKGWRWRVAHAGVYGIAQSPGFVGYKRPSMRVPGVRNLFLVSNTVREARGISMSAVGKCARMAAEAILSGG
jgi:phytoene dehydrogenase-like protein